MTISAIIPTKYRHQDLLNTLESIYSQIYLPDEIIIVDDNISSDVKNAVLAGFAGLDESKKKNITMKYIHGNPTTGLTQARNKGIEKNESDIVLFLDDDVILEKDFIFNILEIHKKHPEICGLSGVITNLKIGLIETLIRKIFEVGNFADNRVFVYSRPEYKNAEYVIIPILSGGLTSYKKEVLQEFKFDENFIKYGLTEDIDFSFRVSRKYKIAITPRARLAHISSESGKADNKKFRENLILSMYYFFKKNLDKNIYNYLCFILLNIGFIFSSLLIAVFKQDTDFIIGNIRGLKKLLKHEDSDFVQVSNLPRNFK